MEAKARLKNVPMSARKFRQVVDMVRGQRVDRALNMLKFNKREAATWSEKLLLSAIANWENKNDMAFSADDYDLYLKTAFVDSGTSLKRFRPAPHGRAHRIRKRQSHVTFIVENRIPLEETSEQTED